MRRALSIVWLLLVVAPAVAGAQTTTADGVQALLRGDYVNAVRILKPLADAPNPDPTAQFFIAIAYDSGLGLPRFDFRSCRYYLEAAKPANPFMTASAALGDSVRQLLPPAAVEFCSGPVPFPDPPPNPARAPIAAVGPEVARAVDALIHGEYARAYQILKPIAEPRETSNHAAQFILGTMYDDGRGAPRDPTRACALYHRAMSGPSNELFNQQAMSLARHFFFARGKDAYAECDLLANVGFDHGFEPVTFTLEPGHSISIDVQGATIVYEGREKRLDRGWLGFGAPGAKFLPARHTALETRRPIPERRHFIELFTWLSEGRDSWTLVWHVLEVVRDEVREAVRGELAHVSGPNPPADPELRDRGVLRVNEIGDAEFEIRGEGVRRTGGIPSETERREIEQEKRAKAAAEARVDWNLARDLTRSPSLVYRDSDGCYGGMMFGWSADRTEAITVDARNGALNQPAVTRSFDLASERGRTVTVHVCERPIRSWRYCSDVVILPAPAEEQWTAVAGTVTIQTTPAGYRASMSRQYGATVTITGAEFVNSSGLRVRPPRAITFNAAAIGFTGP
jgi:Sel1 repeat